MSEERKEVIAPWELAHGQERQFFSSVGAAWRIRNFELSDEGGLRSTRGPFPWEPSRGAGLPSATSGRCHGLFHAVLGEGARQVLLAHFADKLLVWQGWNRAWATLLSGLPDDDWAVPPTQFETDGRRIFIAMGLDQPIRWYDGESLGVLGHPHVPAAPSILLSADEGGGLGTVDGTYGLHDGGLLPGVWHYHLIEEDRFGDRSAPSAPGVLAYDGEPGLTDPSSSRKRALVTRSPGGDHVEGARLYRSPDRLNSGDITPREWLMSTAPSTNGMAFPDAICTLIVDRRPDGLLGNEMPDLRPMPRGEIIRMAMGRMFVAGIRDEPGLLYFSKRGFPGTYGTFDWLPPDPRGSGISALAKVPNGVLALTTRASFLVEPNPGVPDAFQSRPVSDYANCVARDSVQSHQGARTLWLGDGAVYSYDWRTGATDRVSQDIRSIIRDISSSRKNMAASAVDPRTGEYLLAVSDGSTLGNNLILAFDGTHWRERTDVQASAFCVTASHEALVLAGGTVGGSRSVWVMDHEGYGYTAPARTSTFESRFFYPGGAGTRVTFVALVLFFRELSDDAISLSFFRDGERAIVDKTASISDSRYKPKPAAVWGTATYGTGDAAEKWREGRRFARMVPVNLSSAESAAFRMECSGKVEFTGYSWVYMGGKDSRARIPK